MVILYLEVLIAICLMAVEIVMLHRVKKTNENWWRTFWAKENAMMYRVKVIDEKMDEIRRGMNG